MQIPGQREYLINTSVCKYNTKACINRYMHKVTHIYCLHRLYCSKLLGAPVMVCVVGEALINCLHNLYMQCTFVDNSVQVEGARDYGHTHISEVQLLNSSFGNYHAACTSLLACVLSDAPSWVSYCVFVMRFYQIIGHAERFENKAILLIHFSARHTAEVLLQKAILLSNLFLKSPQWISHRVTAHIMSSCCSSSSKILSLLFDEPPLPRSELTHWLPYSTEAWALVVILTEKSRHPAIKPSYI